MIQKLLISITAPKFCIGNKEIVVTVSYCATFFFAFFFYAILAAFTTFATFPNSP
jgi:hypothetical protein